MTIFVSPAEPLALRAGTGYKTSSLPERFGLDFMWMVKGNRHGIQRKEIEDLKASVDDGRLGKELGQMRSGGVQGVVVIEGKASWTTEGEMLGSGYGRAWTRGQWWGVQLAIQMEGAWLCQVPTMADTMAFVGNFHAWTLKRRHGSLGERPGVKGIWGTKATDVDYACHVLTSIPGVGQETARAIYEHFGGLPFALTCGAGELEKVVGVGRKRARQMVELFGQGGVGGEAEVQS